MALDCKFYHRFILDGTILVETEFFYNRNNQELNEWMLKLFFEKNKKLKKKKTVDNFTVSLTEEDLKYLEIDYYRSCYVFYREMKHVCYKKVVSFINPSIEVEIDDFREHVYPVCEVIGEVKIDLSKQDLEQLFTSAKHYLSLGEEVFYMGSS